MRLLIRRPQNKKGKRVLLRNLEALNPQKKQKLKLKPQNDACRIHADVLLGSLGVGLRRLTAQVESWLTSEPLQKVKLLQTFSLLITVHTETSKRLKS